MAPPLKILISGSGIAGAAFTSWILRAYPTASITLIERSPSLRLTGASVDIRSSAVDIIKLMNAEPEIRKCSTKEEGISWVTGSGRVVGALKATGRTDVQSFTSEYEIFRGELARIFIKPVERKVNIVFAEMVESFVQEEDGVVVSFRNGKESEKFDLLVAADGVGSKIRGQMLGEHPSAQIRDQGIHCAYFTVGKDLLRGSLLAQGFNVSGGRVVYLRPDPSPEGKTRVCLINVTPKSNMEMKERLNRALKEGNEAYMQLMEELFADAGWLLPEILSEMRKSDDFYCSMFGQVRSPILQDGRVVLLGDAGYLTPGFGTSLAIIGAYVLAGELLRAEGDVKVATKRYEELMLPFVKSAQSEGVGEFFMHLANPQTRWGIWVLHVLVWVFTSLNVDKIGMAVAEWFGVAEKKLDMPDYQWPDIE